MNTHTIKVGLIGLGNMGKNHLRVLSMLRGFDLVFVSDLNADLAVHTGKALGVPGLTDPSSMLADVDAVVICSPTVTHADYIRMVSAHVKNIFVEKPLASTLKEAREIEVFAIKHGLNIQVGFIERFNPAVQSLKNVLDRTKQIISLDFTRTNKVSSRITDVDVLTDLMIHDIDLALFLNGPAKSLAAHGFGQSSMLDFASALITHENGRFSRIQASRITDKKIRQIEATCIDMFVDCDLLRKEIMVNRQSETQVGGSLRYTITAVQETIAVAPQEALLSELQAFMSICRLPGSTLVPGVSAGVEALQICSQIQEIVLQ